MLPSRSWGLSLPQVNALLDEFSKLPVCVIDAMTIKEGSPFASSTASRSLMA